MTRGSILIGLLIVYCALLIRVLVFKDVPTIRTGQLIVSFGGTDGGHPPNLVPFKTIVAYLRGQNGLMIAGINLVGNIALLVPLGLLVPSVFRGVTWKRSLALAIGAGLAIETMQTVFNVGVFDVDDVMLNAFGVMIGYGVFATLARWMRSPAVR